MNEQTPVRCERDPDVPLREYIERIFTEREKAVSIAREAELRASEARDKSIDARLEKLNELRTEVIQDRGQFVRSDVLDTMLERVLGRLNQLERNGVRQEALDEQGREVARTRKALIYSVIGGLILTGVNLIINIIQSGGGP